MRLGAGGGNGPRRRRGQWAPGSIGAQGCDGASAKRGRVLGARSDRNRGGRRVAGDGTPMSEREAFDAILASLHETALDRAHWSSATALIDDALGTHGSSMVFGDGDSEKDIRIVFAWSFVRGQRDRAVEREYLQTYYPRDERVPRLRRLPDSRLVHITDLYTDEELKTSATYNELLPRARACNSINVRLDGPDGSRIVWIVNDPVDGNGWSSAQLNLIQRLLPHIRQCVRAQQALAGVGALGASMATLLDTTGLGIVQLDGRGRIVAANDRARDVIRTGEGLFDEDGFLHARSTEDDAQLQAVLARALPPFGVQGAAGSTMVSRPSPLPPLALQVNPVGRPQTDLRVWPVAALVLVADPARRTRIDPAVAAEALGLTGMESRVAVLLAEGMTVRDVAAAMGRGESTIRSHVKHMFAKHGLSRQADLVRLVLAVGGAPESRH